MKPFSFVFTGFPIVFITALSLEEYTPHLSIRQQMPSSECRLNYTTDVWTSCEDVLAQFHITLDQFINANSDIGPECDGFKPGSTYCVYRPGTTRPVSPDGSCGIQVNYNASCIGNSAGNCCGVNGRCGKGTDYCGAGNCQEGDCECGILYSTDGKCGKDYNYLPCPPKFGLCCSASGLLVPSTPLFCGNGFRSQFTNDRDRCGNATQFCSAGCQSGPCLGSSTTIPSSSATPTPTRAPGSISADGTCGYNYQYICKGSTFGACCSAAGFCGNDEYHCSKYLGCQPRFGSCNQTAAM